MTFQRKTYPSTSGGTRVDTFSNEFRARLSWMVSPRPSSTFFSKVSIESTLTPGPMLKIQPMSGARKRATTRSLTSRMAVDYNLKSLGARRWMTRASLVIVGGIKNATGRIPEQAPGNPLSRCRAVVVLVSLERDPNTVVLYMLSGHRDKLCPTLVRRSFIRKMSFHF